jgi:hypothetical protein
MRSLSIATFFTASSRRTHFRIAALGLTAAATLSLAACGEADGAFNRPANGGPASDLSNTCADWQAADYEARAALILDVLLPDGSSVLLHDDYATLLNLEGDIVLYTPDGQTLTDSVDITDWACAQVSPETNLHDARAAVFASSGAPKTCDDYVAASEDVRAIWRLASATSEEPADDAAVVDACDYAGGDADVAFLADDPQVWLDKENREVAEAAKPRVKWHTETQLGYTARFEVSIGEVQRGSEPHPDRAKDGTYCIDGGPAFNCETGTDVLPAFYVGSTCGFNSETDAVIPLTLTATNTTSGYAVPITSAFAVHTTGAAPETVTIDVVGGYTDGNTCISSDNYRTNWVTPNTLWNDPVEPQAQGTGLFFVVLHNYYSPRYPSGNSGDLSRFVIEGSTQISEADPVISVVSDAAFTLSGDAV